MIQVRQRHSTKSKYSKLFNELLATGFSTHTDCEVKRTMLVKLVNGTSEVAKREAEAIYKSIHQKATNSGTQLTQLLKPNQPEIKFQVYKVLKPNDGWYFCLLLVSGEESLEGISKRTSDIDFVDTTSSSVLPNTEQDESIEQSTVVAEDDLTDYDREMYRLYGDHYVPNKAR